MPHIEPLTIIGVIEDEVGTPRGGESRGSALYAVPILLSRKADAIERNLLPTQWDNPPRFTTMHRRGILTVTGDRVILDGTTIDEVAEYHAATLRLVIDTVNELAARERVEQIDALHRSNEKQTTHTEHVLDVAATIDFGANE
jgi:hypothetical protein